MTVKEWLKRGRKLNIEIEQLKEAKKKAFDLACSTSTGSGDEKVQTSKKNSIERKFIDYAEYSQLIDSKIDELINYRRQMFKLINMLENTTYRSILTAYYINCMTWDEVSFTLNLDLRWVYRLHGRALLTIESHYRSLL